MNRYYTAGRTIAACVIMFSISVGDVYAQTGAAATKQMQDTQRAAHKKARNAKSKTPDQSKQQSESPAVPASGVQ